MFSFEFKVLIKVDVIDHQHPEISYVSDRDKELVWADVLQQYFTLDTNNSELKDRVQDWSMNNMAT